MLLEREPVVSVGLMVGVDSVVFELKDEYLEAAGARFGAGSYQARAEAGRIGLSGPDGRALAPMTELRLTAPRAGSSFVVRGITIGIKFHWQRQQDQEFRGGLGIKLDPEGRLVVINEISIEAYLESVISSEMSATAHPELLKAHSIIARSWLLAQLEPWKRPAPASPARVETNGEARELIRWYGRENHVGFDICQDDHCQRYQGLTKATSPTVFESVKATSGQVLTYDGALCDARYSKSCGGMTESFEAAWEDLKIPYLGVSYDGPSFPAEFKLPLSEEAHAEAWIRQAPPAFCHTRDSEILRRILPDFDQETSDFYRWQVVIEQDELQELLSRKLGIDFGPVRRLEPVARGGSGRLVRLKIAGERETVVIGKELEIRRALSPSHLYSSAVVVVPEAEGSGLPRRFTLIGAGWGHGVGLCQIGAALMAEQGYNYQQILRHYYQGATLHALYHGAG